VRRRRTPLFLAPDGYRRRRLMDAARMLPLAGAFLFFLPLLWPRLPAGAGTAAAGLYLFAVWALLILAAQRLSRPILSAAEAGAPDGDPDGIGDGGGLAAGGDAVAGMDPAAKAGAARDRATP
jgi:hypothetical protein